ncbi:MAG: TonB-dependent hemoglobin/transferrin/lactoferrin family receptor [Gallionella sp.]|nr:TonB-dependent hemoglobin/transferrin/lactoferrin family receptor [Gallionella sp.]
MHYLNKQAKLKPLVVAIALAMAANSHAADENVADDNQKLQTLDPVVVSATRTEKRLSQVPASVSVVTRDNFEEQQANTVADVMKKLPNVDFGGGPRTDGQIPTIRGYQGSSITLLVDGARRNADGGGLTTPLYLDPYFLSRAEVVRGSSSSLYGAGGNGGAMVFTTLAAKDLLREGQNLGGDAKVGYLSGDSSKHFNARVYGQGEQFDALLAVGYQEFNDIRQASGTTLQLNSGHGDSGLIKMGFQANNQLRFELSHQLYQKQSLQPNNPQLNSTLQTQLSHINQNETVLKATTLDENGEKALDVRIYQSSLKHQNDANPALAQLYSSSATNTVGGSVQNTTRLASNGFGGHRLTYGVDTYQDKLASLQGAAPSLFNPDGKTQVTGAFLQDEIIVGSNLRITPSARYDQFSASANNSVVPAASFSHLSPKIALAWQTTEQLSLYGSYGQAYRAPTVGEMYSNTLLAGNVAPTGNFFNFAGNANLKPETDTTLEIGANYSKGNLFSADDNLKIRATAFQSKAKDMINSNAIFGTYTRTGFGARILGPVGLIFQAQNVSSASRNGLELEGRYNLNSWQLNANYSTLRVKDDATGNNLFAPPDKLAAQVRYAIPATNVSVLWGTTAVAAQDYDSTVARRRSGYSVHDLYMTWTPLNTKLQLDFGIGNLFDKRYLVYQSGNALAATAYEMGRNYKFTLSGSF